MGTFVVPHIHVSITGKGIILGLLVPDGFFKSSQFTSGYLIVSPANRMNWTAGMTSVYFSIGTSYHSWDIGTRWIMVESKCCNTIYKYRRTCRRLYSQWYELFIN